MTTSLAPTRRSRPFVAPLALSAEEAPALFAELAAGGFLPIEGEPWRTFGFRGTANGAHVRLRVVKASRFSAAYWTSALEIEGVIRPRGTLSELVGSVGSARDRSGIVFGLVLCLAFAAAIAWNGDGGSILVALLFVLIAGAGMALGQRLREDAALSQASQIARSLSLVQSLGGPQAPPAIASGTADRWP